MENVISITEIESLYPNEWILVIDPELGPDMKVRSGVVAAHDRSRQVVYQKAIALKPKHSAVWFNGNPIPAGMAVLL